MALNFAIDEAARGLDLCRCDRTGFAPALSPELKGTACASDTFGGQLNGVAADVLQQAILNPAIESALSVLCRRFSVTGSAD